MTSDRFTSKEDQICFFHPTLDQRPEQVRSVGFKQWWPPPTNRWEMGLPTKSRDSTMKVGKILHSSLLPNKLYFVYAMHSIDFVQIIIKSWRGLQFFLKWHIFNAWSKLLCKNPFFYPVKINFYLIKFSSKYSTLMLKVFHKLLLYILAVSAGQ